LASFRKNRFSHVEDSVQQIAEGGRLHSDKELTLKQIYQQIGTRVCEIYREATARGRKQVQLLKDRKRHREERGLPDELLKYLEESVENTEKNMETMLEIIGAEPRTVIRKGAIQVPIRDISIRISALQVLKSSLDSYCELLQITDLDDAQKIKQLIANLKEIKRSKQALS